MEKNYINTTNNRKRNAFIILFSFIVIPIVGFIYLHNRLIVPPLKIGEKIPSVKVLTIEGKEFFIDSFITKKSILIFFSPDCLHCKNEMVDLSLFYPLIKDSINIAGISSNGTKETIEFVKIHNIPFKIYLDINEQAKRSFCVRPIPAMFFIDEHLKLVQYKTGEQKREHLWLMLKIFSGFVKDTTLVKL